MIWSQMMAAQTSPLSMLTTARLRLRPVRDEDAGATAPLVTPDVAANLSTWPSPMTEAQVLGKIHEAQEMLLRREALSLAIFGKDDGRLIGWIGLMLVEPGVARLGYWLGTEFRKRGYMKEAAGVAVPAAAAALGASEIQALVFASNRASITLLEQLGFAREGEEEVFIETAGQSAVCLRYALTL